MNNITMRMPVEGRDFLKKLALNRIKFGQENNLNQSYSYLFKLIIKFFKENNDCYKKLLETEVKNV